MSISKQLMADISLLLVTIGWGASFILTKSSLAQLPTYNFLAIRFFLAFIISSLIFGKKMMNLDKRTFKYGLILGVVLYGHYAFQTVGLNYTTSSKSAFITGFSVILVPIFSAILIKEIPKKKIIVSAILAITGLGLLTLNQGITGINIGDVYTLACAVVFALYIIFVGKYTVDVESISLAIIQLGVVALLSLLTSVLIESPTIPTGNQIWFNIVLLSVVCTSGAYIVQNIAQKFTTPNHTALIYTAEPVFAAIFAYLIFGELLSPRGITGALIILAGMLLAEVDFDKLLNKKEEERVTKSKKT